MYFLGQYVDIDGNFKHVEHKMQFHNFTALMIVMDMEIGRAMWDIVFVTFSWL